MKTKTLVNIVLLLATLVANGQQVNGNLKATFQTSYLALLGPFSASTGTQDSIQSDWKTVLEQQIKTANNWDLVITPAFEVGLYTMTTVSSKNMVTDTSTATAAVEVRVTIDGAVAAPGQVVYNKRTQQLSAQLEGAIANCLGIVTNATGDLTITLNTNCVTPEVIGLVQDTMSANSFIFAAPNLPTGVHTVQVQARITAMGDNQNGTFTAIGLLGKGTMAVESNRTLKQSPVLYELK